MYGVQDLNPYRKSMVLFSGGIDSTTCLAIAHRHHDQHGGVVEAISIDYGQRHIKETECAKEICNYYGIKHTILSAGNALGQSMLTDKNVDVPDISYDDITGISPTYVPFRNGFMLAMLAAHAQLYANEIVAKLDLGSSVPSDLVTLYFGAHAEDAKNWAYPDCTPEFSGAMANAIYIGTYGTVRLQVPLNYMTKDQIIRRGYELGAPYGKSWSCYKGEELHCGTCPTCRSRKESFEKAGVQDPTVYAA